MSYVSKFYISDTHLLHDNIIPMQPRVFSSIEEHDERIIANWNAVVRDEDIVYHLGDFAFKLTEKADRIRYYFSRMKGRKYLILGNHDVDRDGNPHPTILSLGWEEPPTFMKTVKDGGVDVVLCHYGIREWQGKRKGAVHFYGHSHGNLPSLGMSRDVGVDMPDVNFTPRTFSQLVKSLKP